MKRLNKNICIGCGVCTIICPTNSISINITRAGFIHPKINKNCINCNLCAKVCVNTLSNIQNNHSSYFNNDNKIHSTYCSITSAKDNSKRKGSVSGGFVTLLLKEMLSKNIVDYVSVIDFYPNGSKQSKMVFTNSNNEINLSKDSKYIAVNISDVVKQIMQNPHKKFAIVCLPCQLDAIKNVMRAKNIVTDNIYYIGLICSKTQTYKIFEFYKKILKISLIDDFKFRKKIKKSPGDQYILSKNNAFSVSYKIRRELNNYYKNIRCAYCIDKYNENADIVTGDCFFDPYQTEFGENIVLIKTDKGSKLYDLIEEKISDTEFDDTKYLNNIKLKSIIPNNQNIYSKNKNSFLKVYIYYKHVLKCYFFGLLPLNIMRLKMKDMIKVGVNQIEKNNYI